MNVDGLDYSNAALYYNKQGLLNVEYDIGLRFVLKLSSFQGS